MKKTKMLKKNYEFKTIFDKGKLSSGKYILAFTKKNDELDNYLGIAISVKIAKATRRNYIKRLIRENYRKYENQIEEGYSIVFALKKNAEIEEIDYEKVSVDMKKVLEKAGVLNYKKEEKE